MLPQQLVEQIAFEIQRKAGHPFAFLALGTQRFVFSSGANPVIRLIQAIYDTHPAMARKILRARIYSTDELDEAARGMLRVAAKRCSAPIAPIDHGPWNGALELEEITPLSPPPLVPLTALSAKARSLISEGALMDAAFELASEIPKEKELYLSDRPIAAILVDSAGELIAAARNSNARNRTRHAEVNLIQGLLRERSKKIPAGAKLFVTLKCCRMCAGIIWENAEDRSQLQVFYGEDDPGPNARNTIFSRASAAIEHYLPCQAAASLGRRT